MYIKTLLNRFKKAVLKKLVLIHTLFYLNALSHELQLAPSNNTNHREKPLYSF